MNRRCSPGVGFHGAGHANGSGTRVHARIVRRQTGNANDCHGGLTGETSGFHQGKLTAAKVLVAKDVRYRTFMVPHKNSIRCLSMSLPRTRRGPHIYTELPNLQLSPRNFHFPRKQPGAVISGRIKWHPVTPLGVTLLTELAMGSHNLALGDSKNNTRLNLGHCPTVDASIPAWIRESAGEECWRRVLDAAKIDAPHLVCLLRLLLPSYSASSSPCLPPTTI